MAEAKFVPRDGQVDYTQIRYAPVINCVVKHESKILLVRRSLELRLYPGYWNGVSGFLDDARSVEEHVYKELEEELGIGKVHVKKITRGQVLVQEAPEYNKTWLVFPILVIVDTDKISLDWEAQKAEWLDPKEAKKLNLLPGFDQVLATFF